MDAAYEELHDSEVCTRILREWPKLSGPSRSATLTDLNIDRLTMLALMTLTREKRDQMLLAILREIGSQASVSEMTHVVIPKRANTRALEDSLWIIGPCSWGTMGWYG